MCEKFPRAGNPSRSANLRESCQKRSLFRKDRLHFASRAKIVCLDELEGLAPIDS